MEGYELALTETVPRGRSDFSCGSVAEDDVLWLSAAA
jgi:hypothetical protein